MAIEIGHYGRNITPTVAIKDGIKSLGTAHKRSTVNFALNRTKLGKKTASHRPQTPVIFCIQCRSTMVIGIGHYGRNSARAEAIKGGIKSPDIIDERGTGFYDIESREYPKKQASLEL